MKGIQNAMLLLLLGTGAGYAATAVVNNTGDAGAANAATSPDSTLGAGIITLRSAIQYLNAQGQASNTINFNISGTGPFTIAPQTDLDPIAVPVTIDGYSQPGASANTVTQGDNAVLMIVLNGSNYTVGDGTSTGIGLHLLPGASGSTIKGLVVNEWIYAGILLDGGAADLNGVSILGNFIGTDVTGTQQMANHIGVGLSGLTAVTNTAIGTASNSDRNIIAGSFGFFTQGDYFLSGACISTAGDSNTTVYNNYIGTDKSGTRILGNSQAAFSIYSAQNDIIGGLNEGQANVISGHTVFGVGLAFASGCIIENNYVGTDVTGSKGLGGTNGGILISLLSSSNTISNNVVSGTNIGIEIPFNALSNGNIIQANYVGTDASGYNAVGNVLFGVAMGDNQNTITRNVIADNEIGLIIWGPANENVVQNNLIGVDASGKKMLPNTGNGLQIGIVGGLAGASNNSIGLS